MRILERLWALLPDACEVDDCCRKGVRGNENRIYPFKDDDYWKDFYIVMCDYCNSRYMNGEVMNVAGITSRLIVRPRSAVIDFQRKLKDRRYNK